MVNVKTFDLNLLRVLAALVETRSVSAAARQLGLSQPAASNALARLRSALGDPLLVRQGHAMQPTPLALALLPRVSGMLDEIAAAFAAPGPFDPATETRRFRVLANDYAVITVLEPFLALKAREGWALKLEILPFEDRFGQRLQDEDYDLAIRDDWALREWPHREVLARDFLCGLARIGHQRIGEAPTLEAFLAEHHVLVSPVGQTLGIVDAHLRGRGLSRIIDVFLPHVLAAPALIASSDLIMCVSQKMAAQFQASHAVKTFTPPLPRFDFDVSMAWPARQAADPALQWLKEQLRQLSVNR